MSQGGFGGKYEKIRDGIDRETTNALSHCVILSIITRDAGNTGTFHAPVISTTQISRTPDAISAKKIKALDRAAD